MGKRETTIKLPKGTKVPDHVVIVPDGDRRWARARGLSASEGHRAGIENMINLARYCRDWGIHTVSAWGLSTENWLERPKEEVDFLMKGIVAALDRYVEEMDKDGVKLVHLGRKDRLPKFLLDKIAEVEERTKNNSRYIFNVGLDYNGPDEILRAIQKYVESDKLKVKSEELTKKEFEKYLDTAGQPYPYVDLFIRTSGEQRTSGFLMWQCDYAEFYWEVDHFPAFGSEKLKAAILDYSCRRRRFGGNDAVEHLKFDPKIVSRFEIEIERMVESKKLKVEGQGVRDLVIGYVKEQYGLTKELAAEAGTAFFKALRYRQQSDWDSARKALKGLYNLIKCNVGLALEPEIVANLEVDLWKDPSEEKKRKLLAEKFRFSDFQAAKSAHLGYLASQEEVKGNWAKAKSYLEKYYMALKERVA